MNPRSFAFLASAAAAACFAPLPGASAGVLDKRELSERHPHWYNRDFPWYERSIPFLETPDRDIDVTWYYRWDMMTKHLVYGSPEDGYAFTEFIDRPFWSGTYGAISCPSGLQLYDLRWFRDPVYARDYARYWFRVPGAQPRRYSTWLADSVWAIHQVHPDEAFTGCLFDDLVENFRGWERERWDEETGMFWQIGHDDGMETNINSRQTPDWFRGAPGLRPTLNSYLHADALAIARIADLRGDVESADAFRGIAAGLKERVQENLWDPERKFFFHMFAKDEEKDGHVIRKHTLTHQSGQFAGSPHGRELIGYVPWQFNLPDEGFEEAWKFLMDPYYFYAEFGPTTVERHDPMFFISPNCCVWSGNSWPYATGQTLKAMANLLQFYRQEFVSSDDYVKLLHNYARTHRKDGKPYIAEACHPDTGSWDGHDSYNHSEHYFHSSYIDLVVTGLAGIQPQDGDTIVVHPLFPAHWDYFCLDEVPYKGRSLTVLWDRTGERYGRGKGFRLLADGREIVAAERPEKVRAELQPRTVREQPDASTEPLRNFAVNNTGAYFPRASASFSAPDTPVTKVNDGQYWYLEAPPNRWTAEGSEHESDWCTIDFGIERPVEEVRLHVLDDGSAIVPPTAIELEAWDAAAKAWVAIEGVTRMPSQPTGRMANVLGFPEIRARKVRAVLRHVDGASSGLSEFECWGRSPLPLPEPDALPGNLALRGNGSDFPKATASFTSRFDKVEEVNDGRIGYSPSSRNRWTAYESPDPTDWIEIDFGKPVAANAVHVHLFDDGGGVQRPEKMVLEWWDGTAWVAPASESRRPAEPMGSALNEVRFDRVTSSKLRLVFTHRGASRTGVTEVEVYDLADEDP